MEVDGDELRELEALWRAREAAAGAPVVTCGLPLSLGALNHAQLQGLSRLDGTMKRLLHGDLQCLRPELLADSFSKLWSDDLAPV